MTRLEDGRWITDFYSFFLRIALGMLAATQGPAETPLASKGSQRPRALEPPELHAPRAHVKGINLVY